MTRLPDAPTRTRNGSDNVKDTTYNGWKNRQTWNVALYIQNEYSLYCLAKELAENEDPYESFKDYLRESYEGERISYETPDKVAWNDSGIDTDEINSMIKGLVE